MLALVLLFRVAAVVCGVCFSFLDGNTPGRSRLRVQCLERTKYHSSLRMWGVKQNLPYTYILVYIYILYQYICIYFLYIYRFERL